MLGRWHRNGKQRKINQRIAATARRKRQKRNARVRVAFA